MQLVNIPYTTQNSEEVFIPSGIPLLASVFGTFMRTLLYFRRRWNTTKQSTSCRSFCIAKAVPYWECEFRSTLTFK